MYTNGPGNRAVLFSAEQKEIWTRIYADKSGSDFKPAADSNSVQRQNHSLLSSKNQRLAKR
jgi:hypothetical protein